MTETRWPSNLKHLLSGSLKRSIQIPDREYMILVTAKVKKLGPLTNLSMFIVFINVVRTGSPQGLFFLFLGSSAIQ